MIMHTMKKHDNNAGVPKGKHDVYSWYDNEKIKRLTTVLLGLIIAGYLLILKIPVFPSHSGQKAKEPQVTSDTKLMTPDEVISIL